MLSPRVVGIPLLIPGESVVLIERTETDCGHVGNLTLTNLRFVFEARKQQSVLQVAEKGEQLHTQLNLRVAAISNAFRDKPLIGRATPRIEAGTASYTFKVKDAASWLAELQRALQTPARMGIPAAAVPTVSVSLTQSAPPVASPQVYLHCTHCGSRVTPSAAGPLLELRRSPLNHGGGAHLRRARLRRLLHGPWTKVTALRRRLPKPTRERSLGAPAGKGFASVVDTPVVVRDPSTRL
jgi:hypothetical protein